MTHNTSEPPDLQIPPETCIVFPAATGGLQPRPATTYHQPAALADVLYEQLDYLLDHGDACLPGCQECERLERVKHFLLRPFTGK